MVNVKLPMQTPASLPVIAGKLKSSGLLNGRSVMELVTPLTLCKVPAWFCQTTVLPVGTSRLAGVKA